MNDSQSPSAKPNPQNPLPPSPTEKTTAPLLPLVERVASLEASNEKLGEVVDKNATALRDCFEITEARQWMIMAALDDMVASGTGARTLGTPPNLTGVDWEHYKERYFAFQEKLRAEAEAATQESPIPPDVVVFGGGG